MKTPHFLFALVGLALLSSTAESREPTQLEQYYLELVNRARANPEAEVARLSGETWGDKGSPVAPDLNEGIAPETITPTPKPPLAFDTRLIDAANDYSDFLLAVERFGHTEKGTAVSRMIAAGYSFTPPSSAGENLAITASSGPHPVNLERVEEHHSGLFVDNDVAGRGHRISILNANFREVGIAIRADRNGQSLFGPGFNDVLSTQNFATTAGRVFVTGVIYQDTNNNHFYDPGESSGILVIQVRTLGGTTVASGKSFGSGGYSINLATVPPGEYQLVAIDASGSERSVTFTWNGAHNVKTDLRNPYFFLPPVLNLPHRPDGSIGLTSLRQIGNDVYSDSASLQRVAQVARNPRSLAWSAFFENDGEESDTLRMSASRRNRFYRLAYFRRNSNGGFANVTAAMNVGNADVLPAFTDREYRVLAAPQRLALGKRRRGFAFHLRAVSANSPALVDRINGTVTNRTKAPKKRLRRR